MKSRHSLRSVEWPGRADFDEKAALIVPLSIDSVSQVIWGTEVDDGITSGSAVGAIL